MSTSPVRLFYSVGFVLSSLGCALRPSHANALSPIEADAVIVALLRELDPLEVCGRSTCGSTFLVPNVFVAQQFGRQSPPVTVFAKVGDAVGRSAGLPFDLRLSDRRANREAGEVSVEVSIWTRVLSNGEIGVTADILSDRHPFGVSVFARVVPVASRWRVISIQYFPY